MEAFVWFFPSPPGWLAGWLVGWLVGWLAGWLHVPLFFTCVYHMHLFSFFPIQLISVLETKLLLDTQTSFRQDCSIFDRIKLHAADYSQRCACGHPVCSGSNTIGKETSTPTACASQFIISLEIYCSHPHANELLVCPHPTLHNCHLCCHL
ncbi:hypothetical protein BGX38DRAFT_448287 [Terfezia claveryi]|nr:hypothetical protein BGX38DRAFT_448287 [Terfezia claveryi]